MRNLSVLLIFACGCTLLGCAAPTTRQAGLDPELVRLEEQKQLQLAIRKDREYDARLQRVAWPLLSRAAPLCEGNTLPRLGFNFATIHAFPKDHQTAARAELGLDDRLRIIGVTANGPADKAGLEVGDVVLRINGQAVPTGKKSVKKFAKLAADAVDTVPEISLDLLRENQEISITATLEEVCRFPVVYTSSDEINAFADGDNIYVTRGMMRFAEDDTELSLVVAHELAHNSQQHIKAKMKNSLFGAIFDITAAAYGVNTQGAFSNMAAGAYSQEFEAEADYVGLYMMSYADIDLNSAADFWRQMGVQNKNSITKNYASSHPSTAERSLAIENAVREIVIKEKDGLALKPEMKK